jgi:NAD(P)H-hydrate epimerase
LIPSLILMENAGRTCAERLIWHSHRKPLSEQAVVVLCGPGNNGGDGFVIARHLYNAGIKVKVVLFRAAEGYTGDSLLNLTALSRLRLPVVEFNDAWSDEKLEEVMSKVRRSESTWVVDALLGTGATGDPRGGMARAIRQANRMEVRRFAIDIPTGLDCDSGSVSKTTFRADLTCTFIDTKVGFQNEDASPFLGQVVVVGIGAPDEIQN